MLLNLFLTLQIKIQMTYANLRQKKEPKNTVFSKTYKNRTEYFQLSFRLFDEKV